MESFDDAPIGDPQDPSGFSPPKGHPYVIELRQKVTMVQNVWAAFYLSPEGTEVQVAQVAQKRFKLKEAVNVETPDGAPLLTIKARKVFEVGGTYDVHDAAGNLLATLTKEFEKSLVRSTYRISTPVGELVTHERGAVRAVVRRLWSLTDFPWFLPVQFDIVRQGSDGTQPVATIDRQMKLRDHYRIEVRDPQLDWRVATSIGVATDAFMDR